MSGNFARMLHVVPPEQAPRLIPDAASPAAQTDSELIAELRGHIAGLHEAMESRATIEQAKGMAMLCYGLPPDRAFAVLVRWSSMWNVKLRVVAATLVRVAQRAPIGPVGPVSAQELAAELQPPKQ